MKRLITIFMVLALLLSGMSGSLPETVYAQDDNISAVTETEEETSTDVSEPMLQMMKTQKTSKIRKIPKKRTVRRIQKIRKQAKKTLKVIYPHFLMMKKSKRTITIIKMIQLPF